MYCLIKIKKNMQSVLYSYFKNQHTVNTTTRLNSFMIFLTTLLHCEPSFGSSNKQFLYITCRGAGNLPLFAWNFVKLKQHIHTRQILRFSVLFITAMQELRSKTLEKDTGRTTIYNIKRQYYTKFCLQEQKHIELIYLLLCL